MIKVLHINPYPPENLGGSEIFTFNLAKRLNCLNDFESVILTSNVVKNRNKENLFGDTNLNIIYKRCFYNLWNKNPVVNILNFLKKNYKKYDIIHTHSYLFFTSIQCALFRKIRNFPMVLHIHGGIQTYSTYELSLYEKLQLSYKLKIFDNYLGKIPIKIADAIISVSKKDLDFIKNKYRIKEGSYFYIPNGVDLNKFKRIPNLERKFITFIGRLSYIKGFDIFLKIINELYKLNKNLKFLVIGDGPMKANLLFAKKNLPIRYLSYYPYNKIQDIYNLSKIILITSRFEGIPTCGLESLACKTPVISSNLEGISEFNIHRKTGLLFNINHYKHHIYEILDLINNQKLLEEFGNNGRNLVKKNYNWENITIDISNIYYSLASGI